jgi:hypothetical protein
MPKLASSNFAIDNIFNIKPEEKIESFIIKTITFFALLHEMVMIIINIEFRQIYSGRNKKYLK